MRTPSLYDQTAAELPLSDMQDQIFRPPHHPIMIKDDTPLAFLDGRR